MTLIYILAGFYIAFLTNFNVTVDLAVFFIHHKSTINIYFGSVYINSLVYYENM